MALKDSVARLKNSRREVNLWCSGGSTQSTSLGSAFDAGPGSTFRAYPGLDAHGVPDLHFTIHLPDGTVKGMGITGGGDDEFNSSHPCPGNPGCPE